MRVVINLDSRPPAAPLVAGRRGPMVAPPRPRPAARPRGEDFGGREVLTYESTDPLDAMDRHHRTAAAEHKGRLV